MGDSSSPKQTRCIICRNSSNQNQSYNIFSTTLDRGKILLSDFVKNVLSCSVLIVVSPEFFLCKRCFLLCTELDLTLARCNELQETIQKLFKNAKEDDEQVDSSQEPVNVKAEQVEQEEICDEVQEDQMEYGREIQCVNGETIEDIETFLASDIVESDVTVVTTNPVVDDNTAEIETDADENNSAKENSMEDLNIPRDSGESNNKFTCRPCKMSFETMELLKSHKNTNLCIATTKTAGIKSTYEFKNYSVKLKKRKKVYFCNHCSYETPSSTAIQKHLITHKTDPLFMCDVCGKRFKYMKTFNNHLQIHDESRPFACSLCSYRAVSELKLKIHERLHDDQKKYFCTKCNYKTLKKMSFLIHSRTHTGERPYSCPDCPYKAKDSSTLIRHRRIHGGLKRYHCPYCDYKSVQKNSLNLHMMTHTGEKPHACQHCDYRSVTRHNLMSHIAARHCDDKPYACNLCPYSTKMKRLLTYHMRKHSGEKPYACKLCDFRVRYRGGLSYHMRTKHPTGDQALPHRVLSKCEVTRLHFQGEDVQFSDDGESDIEIEIEIS
uniref:C2H2-type domain-containing protein n=1 Tax=Cuerna arida TaxID=1464854 RepID=A0A1B6GAQ3_9HEMI